MTVDPRQTTGLCPCGHTFAMCHRENARKWCPVGPPYPDGAATLNLVHDIAVTWEKCRCGSPGHREPVIRCSCGLDERVNHGTRQDADRVVLGHRIVALEAAVGIKLGIKWAP